MVVTGKKLLLPLAFVTAVSAPREGVTLRKLLKIIKLGIHLMFMLKEQSLKELQLKIYWVNKRSF